MKILKVGHLNIMSWAVNSQQGSILNYVIFADTSTQIFESSSCLKYEFLTEKCFKKKIESIN